MRIGCPRCNARLIKNHFWFWLVVILAALCLLLSFPIIASSTQTEAHAAPAPVPHETFETLLPTLAKKYGQNEALARRIIGCESSNVATSTHDNYNKKGILWSTDHGYWQINDYWNEAEANRHGFDIRNDWQDNLEWGFKMMRDQGTGPWSASEYCWKV